MKTATLIRPVQFYSVAICWALLTLSAVAAEAEKGKQSEDLTDLDLKALMNMDVIVTAQRRSEKLQDVPISITALKGKRLEDSNIYDIRDLRAQIPNLNVESSFGKAFPRFYIRGLGVDDFAINLVTPVALYNDEVILQSPILGGTPAFDLDHIEILRGPQGTLWGKNTTGGAIHLITRKPSETFEGNVRATYGSFNEHDVEGAIGGPLVNDELAARASFISQNRDGWILNRVTGKHLEGYGDLAGRVQFLWTPREQFDALLNFHGRKLASDSTTFHLDLENTAREDSVALDQPNLLDETQNGFSLNMNYRFGGATLTSITAFEKGNWNGLFDIDGSDSVRLHEQFKVNDIHQFSQELRLTSNGERRLNWIAGLHYFQDMLDSFAALEFSPFFAERLDSIHHSRSYAAFGHLAFDITNRLNVSAGLRWTDENKELTQTDRLYGPAPGSNGFDPNAPGAVSFGPGTAAGTLQKSWSQFTGDAAALYSLTRHVNLYAKVARGFRAGAFDGLATTPNKIGTVNPEVLTSFESGLKAVLLNERLRLSVNGFYYDYKHNQFFFTTVGALFSRELRNAAGGKVYGSEFEAAFAPTNRWFLQAGLGYAKTTFNGPTVVQDPFDFQVPVDVKGKEFVRAPRLTSNVLARYTVPWEHGIIYVQTDWVYTGTVFHDPTNNPRLRAPAYWQGGLRTGFKTAKDRWEAAVWGRNLTDSDSFSNMFAIDGKVAGVFEGGPRIFGADLIFKF